MNARRRAECSDAARKYVAASDGRDWNELECMLAKTRLRHWLELGEEVRAGDCSFTIEPKLKFEYSDEVRRMEEELRERKQMERKTGVAPVDGSLVLCVMNPALRKRHPNYGAPWTRDDIRRLCVGLERGASGENVVRELGRNPGGVTAVLKKICQA